MENWKRYNLTQYEVSDTGSVQNIKTLRLITPVISSTGYHTFSLWQRGSRYTAKIHRLVAQCFLENPNDLPEVNHKDGNRLNNRVSNLEWATHSENMEHAWQHALCLSGEDAYNAVLTVQNVKEIKQAFVDFKLTNAQLAKRYGVQDGTIHKIRVKATWKAVCPELQYLPGGPDNNVKKLCGEDIPIIRKLAEDGVAQATIARKFNVNSGTIYSILSGKNWKNY